MDLVGWTNHKTQQFKWVSEAVTNPQIYAFSGIYLVDPGFANLLPYDGKFSIIDAWLKMAKNKKIIGYPDDSPLWFDLGTAEKIRTAEKIIHNKQEKSI